MIIGQITTNIQQFEDFEKKLLENGQIEIEKKLNAVYSVTKLLLTEDIILADLQIVYCYLKKSTAIIKNENNPNQISELDEEIKMYAEKYPFINSNHLYLAVKTACIDPVDLIKITSGLSTRELATASSVVSSRIRQLASEIPGGVHTNSGWIFPYDAVAWVQKQSGAGRPVKNKNPEK